MQPFSSMQEAIQYIEHARTRNQIWLITSFEGHIYYAYVSKPNDNYFENAKKMIAVHNELLTGRHSTRNLTPEESNQLVQRLGNLMKEGANFKDIDVGRHAEEIFIAEWDSCLATFEKKLGRKPKKLDLFISNTPCITADKTASRKRMLGKQEYPLSCTNKLRLFQKMNRWVKLHVYYYNKYGKNEPLSDQEIKDFFKENEISISKMTVIHMQDICGSIV